MSWRTTCEREQLAELDLRLYFGLAGLPELELEQASGALPGIHLGTPRPARQSLYVTGRINAAGCRAADSPVHEPAEECTNTAQNRRWGGRNSNPRPADYESAPAVHCVSMGVYTRRLQASVDG